ncbi:hypothetical protein TNCV_1583571 [Trichonephila clavipes]|nr:hypothetical protein TNCV_1583571 [Trichonephila clavipes]
MASRALGTQWSTLHFHDLKACCCALPSKPRRLSFNKLKQNRMFSSCDALPHPRGCLTVALDNSPDPKDWATTIDEVWQRLEEAWNDMPVSVFQVQFDYV